MRSQGLACTAHARLPTALAELQSGWEIWLQFALEAGAIGSEEQPELADRCSRALAELAACRLLTRWRATRRCGL